MKTKMMLYLDNSPYEWWTEDILGRGDFMYLYLNDPKNTDSPYKILMQGEESVEELQVYVKDHFGVEI